MSILGMSKKQLAAVIVVLLLVGGVSYVAGYRHDGGNRRDKLQQMRGNFGSERNGNGSGQGMGVGMQNQNGNPGMMQGGGPASGPQNGNGQNGPQNGMGQGNGPMMGQAGMIAGKITEKNDKSLTIELSDGTTKTITYADSTAITKEDSASDSDLNVGTQVTVNPDNSSLGTDSIVAKSIQIQTEK